MPDWFYRTVAQRLLFRMPERFSHHLALGTIGTLGRLRAGRAVIDLLGHMRADRRLAGEKAGVRFGSPFGLGIAIDPEGRATEALARFGAGFVEVGPVSMSDLAGDLPHRSDKQHRLVVPAHSRTEALVTWQKRLARQSKLAVPRWIRLTGRADPRGATSADDLRALIRALEPWADAFVIEDAPADLAWSSPRPWLLAAKAGLNPDECAIPGSAAGVLVRLEEIAQPHEHVRWWRHKLGPVRVLVVTSAGEPADFVGLLESGADMVQVDSGLVYSGPGLLKRANELRLKCAARDAGAGALQEDSVEGTPRFAWFWLAILGAALACGGLITLALSLSDVLLPYDEHHLGIDAATLARLQPRLHAFMAHDRATLAGTMIGLGALYLLTARNGVRRGQHWAQVAITTSAIAGFATFFFFLGFGYFDPLHAYVSVVLLQFTVLGMVCRLGGAAPENTGTDEREDPAWRRAQWGQLLLVVHAVGLIIAGAVISVIGMTHVFVRTDLEFLCASPADLAAFNDRLVAVVAHDRASLGGMLLASGLAQGLATLWGMRRGRRWLWRAMFWLGAPAYAAALGVHLWVGYTDSLHLAPAFAGMLLWAGGLALARSWMHPPGENRSEHPQE